MKITTVKFGLLAGCLISVMGMGALAQERERTPNPAVPAQIVALDLNFFAITRPIRRFLIRQSFSIGRPRQRAGVSGDFI